MFDKEHSNPNQKHLQQPAVADSVVTVNLQETAVADVRDNREGGTTRDC